MDEAKRTEDERNGENPGEEGMKRCSEKLAFPRKGYPTTINRGAKRSTNRARLQNLLVPQTA
jgi:hypothetical protein